MPEDPDFDFFAPDLVWQISYTAITASFGQPRRAMYDSDRIGYMWIQELFAGHPDRFQDMFRMDQKSFLLLCDYLEGRELLKITRKGSRWRNNWLFFCLC
jgi:hypothetical protein